MKLTVLTPTFNRGGVLQNLYKSLNEQSCKEFEWIVVDDGSNDNTKELISKWLRESDICIRYLHKENGGKHTALNYAIKQIESELIFIVDSDDILTADAVETVLRYHRRYEDDANLCGYVFLRAYPDGKINGKEFVPDEKVASYIEARVNADDTLSDKAEVYRTKCLKEYPFPEFPGEKFLGEDIVWIRMARKYSMVHINKAIYIGNYQDDGLTKNRRAHNIKSPVGCMNRAKEFMCPELKLRYRLKATLQHIVYGKFAGINICEIIGDSPCKILTVLCILPGLAIYQKWKREFYHL